MQSVMTQAVADHVGYRALWKKYEEARRTISRLSSARHAVGGTFLSSIRKYGY